VRFCLKHVFIHDSFMSREGMLIKSSMDSRLIGVNQNVLHTEGLSLHLLVCISGKVQNDIAKT